MILRIYDFFIRKSSGVRTALKILLFVIIALIFLFIFRNPVFAIFLGICISLGISEIARSINERRLEVLHSQLIEFLINMIVMVRAGRNVRNIIIESVNWTKDPLRFYLKNLASELELNVLFDIALDDFAKSCSSREAILLVTALKLNNRIGGDLVFVLGNIVETLQESLRFRSNARTITLQSRYSGTIIALLPVIILFFLFFFIRGSLQEFFSSRAGNILIIAGGILEILGIISIRKILTQKS